MKVLKTWLNGWHTSSRCQAAHVYPCLFGCHGARDDLHHYIICPQLYSLRKHLHRDLSQYPLDRFGLYSPGHELMVHPCCAYGAYHTLINYVKSNHELYHEHEEQLLIRPCEKAWSVFAEAYQADARDFWGSVPHCLLHAFLDWRLNFEDPTLICSAFLVPAPVCNHEDCIPEFVPALTTI